MSFIEPSFEVDHKGRVICQYHSNYAYFVKPGKKEEEERQVDRELTCLNCTHYENDECFFPKSEIDKIERHRILFNEFPCKFCGNRIDLLITIMQKLYIKDKYNIELPLVCCSCYAGLKKEDFVERSKWKANRILYLTLLSIPFLIQAILSMVFYQFSGFLFLLIALNSVCLIVNLKRRRRVLEGIKYYQKFNLKDDKLA